MPDLESLVPESSHPSLVNVVGSPLSSAVSNTSGTSSVQSDCSVLSHDNGRHLEIAAIESTFMVHEFDKRKQKWVERTRTVFNVIIEDKYQNRSLVRYVPDFVEFDRRLKTHYRKSRVTLPQLVEPHFDFYTGHPNNNNPYDTKKKSRRRNSVSSLLSRIIKLTTASMSGKSNSEKIEMYLRKCALHPTVGRSSLFRDFLAAQREEDQIVPNRAILEQIQLEQNRILSHRASSMVAAPSPSPALITVPSIAVAATAVMMNHDNDNNHMAPTSSSISMSTSSSMIISSSLDSCHDNNHSIINPTVTNNNTLGGGIPIHVPRTASTSEIVIDGRNVSRTTTYESLIDVDDDKPTKITIWDFEMLKVLGRGCTGKVFLVRRTHPPSKLLALKAIRKQWVITSTQIENAKTERDILTKISKIHHPFLIKLHYAFQDPNQLFLVFDFHVGGDLATQLRNYGRFTPKRCKLYAAEMFLGLEELHRLGILYRDLKPENILLRADGHLILTDFSMSKLLNTNGLEEERARTFCGTPEYLAPEVLLGEEYSYAVDFWSYGTILYEMLEGETPFWVENTRAMFLRILEAPLLLPGHLDPEVSHLLEGLLERDPCHRMSVEEIRDHPYFNTLDWDDVYHRRILPPYVPDLQSKDDCANFDQECLAESPRLSGTSMPDDSQISDVQQQQQQQQNSSGMTFQGYSYINDSQMTEDTPSFTNDSRWMLTEEDETFSHDGDGYYHTNNSSGYCYQQQQQQHNRRHQNMVEEGRYQSDMSLLLADSLKSHNNDRSAAAVTNPTNPSTFTGVQQRNSRVYYYNDSEVVPYDITTESDEYMPTAGTRGITPSYYYGTGSAILSADDEHYDDDDYGDDDDDDEEEETYHHHTDMEQQLNSHSSNNNTSNKKYLLSRQQQFPGISLSRHYGARQINANI
ncbi:kinase-like domain-containing protein [Phascolomyces articulosus]|uniref:Kinase-like domain-containing protein n=1 Tax=Phascolomyces articulosus TaxID=60185 RepID=A0AAD5KNQ6_9FUNG|nr:kinase-like domain-containing protein [Phascolomyces articulosus]